MIKPKNSHLQLTHLPIYIPYTGTYALCCHADFTHDILTHKMTEVRSQVTCKACKTFKRVEYRD